MDKERLQQLAGIEQLDEMSMMSDLGRKMSGKVSGKEQIRRISLQTLQQLVNGISYNNLHDMFGGDFDPEVAEYLDGLRKDAVHAIEIIKGVEK